MQKWIFFICLLPLFFFAGCSSTPAPNSEIKIKEPAKKQIESKEQKLAVKTKEQKEIKQPASAVKKQIESIKTKSEEQKKIAIKKVEQSKQVIKENLKFQKIKAGFVYLSPPGDAGWTKAHDDGRKLLAKLPFVVVTEYIENVEEAEKPCQLAIEKLIKKGCNLIFTTSWGFMDPTLTMAKKYPNIVFMHCSGYKTLSNMGTYFGRIYQARYLSGLIAGKLTNKNKIGYLLPFPIPECIRGVNAFTIGVREVNPDATVEIMWTHTWYNPDKERNIAKMLVDKGIDIIAQHQDSPAALIVAQENNIYGLGYNSDMKFFAPQAYLTAPIWHWDKICKGVAKQLYEGQWKSEQIWWGLEKGAVGLAPLSDKIPAEVKKIVEIKKQQIIDGKFKVFSGPLKDKNGNLKLKKGNFFTDKDLLSMKFLIEGIIGTIPAKSNKENDLLDESEFLEEE